MSTPESQPTEPSEADLEKPTPNSPEKSDSGPSTKSIIREYAEALIIAIILALTIRVFVVQAFKIPSGSMIPTLLIGDHILVSKLAYGFQLPKDCEFQLAFPPATCFSSSVVMNFSEPQRGDVIVEYEGEAVEDPRTLQGQVVSTVVGNQVALVVMREGRKMTLRPVIREQNESKKVAQANSAPQDGPLASVAVQELDGRMAAKLGIAEEVSGVVVREVPPGSYAARAGLVQGDVISEINRKPVRSEEDFSQVVSHLANQQDALIFIYRGQGALYLTVKI